VSEVTIDADTLGLLAFLASDYDRRLPHGNIPPGVWELLPLEWRNRINGGVPDYRWEARRKT
jgi:hypothetical protein